MQTEQQLARRSDDECVCPVHSLSSKSTYGVKYNLDISVYLELSVGATGSMLRFTPFGIRTQLNPAVYLFTCWGISERDSLIGSSCYYWFGTWIYYLVFRSSGSTGTDSWVLASSSPPPTKEVSLESPCSAERVILFPKILTRSALIMQLANKDTLPCACWSCTIYWRFQKCFAVNLIILCDSLYLCRSSFSETLLKGCG